MVTLIWTWSIKLLLWAPQNMHHQLVNSIGKHNLPTPHSFLAPLTHKVIGDFSRAVDMILPHELFAAIYHCYKKAWVNRICPSRARVEKFWESVNGTTQFLTHPVRLRPNFRSHCIPLSIHGDGTPVVGIGKAWGKLLDIWSWQSLLVSGPTILRTMLIFCVHSDIQSVNDKHNTLDMMCKKWLGQSMLFGRVTIQNWIGMTIQCPKVLSMVHLQMFCLHVCGSSLVT